MCSRKELAIDETTTLMINEEAMQTGQRHIII
jgi:hypothetical protein